MLTKTIIDGLEVEYNIVHRKIKYPRLELKTGNLLLVVPKGYKNPEKLIEEHKEWIHNKISAIKDSKERSKGKKLNLNRDEYALRELLLFSVNKFSRELNVKPKKNLNFNKLLKYLPDDLVKYVVLHEIAHLREKKHDEEFWKIVSAKFVNYKEKEKDLMDYWFLIQSQ